MESSQTVYDLWSGGVYASVEGGNHCSPTTVSRPSPDTDSVSLAAAGLLSCNVTFLLHFWQVAENWDRHGWRRGTEAAGHQEIFRESFRRW